MDDELLRQQADGVLTLTLNRPEKRNALTPTLMADLAGNLPPLASDVRAVVIRSSGDVFCSGADITWMHAMRGKPYEENVADAKRLADVLRTVAECHVPVVAIVQGPAYGAAMGLLAAADVVVAVDTATFGFKEVKLGIAPATVSAYVLPKTGTSWARRYFLTGERFSAERAMHLGLVHEVCQPDGLERVADGLLEELRSSAPEAVRATKALLARWPARRANTEDWVHSTTDLLARLRVSAEGREGMEAFFEGRPPDWKSVDVAIATEGGDV